MNEQTEKEEYESTSPLTLKRALYFTLGGMLFLLGIAFVFYRLWQFTQPSIVEPNVVIDQLGNYQVASSGFNFRVHSSEPPGELTFEASSSSSYYALYFPASDDWYITIDRWNRVFIYTSTHGVLYHENDTKGVRAVELGDLYWVELPLNFADRLPDKLRDQYETWKNSQNP
ncbi:MAG: hypothetical protein HUJ26_21820 [Planctomycetaceae bacterium]|nr:hypothetical protein [Planctomycetaceae bacterium]